MPYTERQAEAFLQAQEQQRQQEAQPQEPQGVLVQGTAPGVKAPIDFPKYRKPTEDEVKQTVADIKTAGALASGTVGLPLGPIGSGVLGTLTTAGLEKISPKLEKWVGNSATEPVYENWTENDFWNAYHGH